MGLSLGHGMWCFWNGLGGRDGPSAGVGVMVGSMVGHPMMTILLCHRLLYPGADGSGYV